MIIIKLTLKGHEPEGGEHEKYILLKELEMFLRNRPNVEMEVVENS